MSPSVPDPSVGSARAGSPLPGRSSAPSVVRGGSEPERGSGLHRHAGLCAEEAYQRARLAEREAAGDAAGEREAATALARLLASRGTALDEATALGQRALELGEDPALRTDLAGWLAGLGEPALAAATLRGLVGSACTAEMAPALIRIAVLLARSDDPAGAAEALAEAAALDPSEAIASELLGTLAAWAPAEVPPAASSAAYLEAALRRDAHHEKDAAFEDRLRAFEIAPSEPDPALALASALGRRGRTAAADEVLRAHATAVWAVDPARARDIHRGRLLAALREGDAARGVGAALDADLEGELEGELGLKVDEVSAAAGLDELFAFRLELKAENRKGAARADTYQALARLYAGPLASQECAADAWVEVLASRPDSALAREQLREGAARLHDRAPLVEALVRVALHDPSLAAGPGGPRSQVAASAVRLARIDALRELATLAEGELGDASLASFAHRRLLDTGAGDESSAALVRLAPGERAQDEAIAAAQSALTTALGDARLPQLAALAGLYAGRPEEPEPHLDVLAELVTRQPSDRAAALAFERVSFRTGKLDRLETVLRARLATGLARAELVRVRLLLSAIARRQHDDARALEEVLPLATEAPGHRAAASAMLVLAARLGHARERGEALVQLARPVGAALRSVLLSVAAEVYGRVGNYETARRVAEQAAEADPTCARAVAMLAVLASAQRDRVAVRAVERAMGVVVPRGSLCDGLGEALEELGELPLALAWTQRWLALRPGCPRAIKKLLRRAVAARDPSRLADGIAWMLAQPEPMGSLVTAFTEALQALFELDSPRALAFARRALDVFGPRVPPLRNQVLELAARGADSALAIAVLERWLASEPDARRAVAARLDLARRRADVANWDGAARDLWRASQRLPLPGQAPDSAAGESPEPIVLLEEIESVDRQVAAAGASLGPDGLVALTEARARALAGLGADRVAEAAIVWRQLGVLRWDLAHDAIGAEQAFYLACELEGDGGIARYAHDLCDCAGVDEALDVLARRSAPPVERASPSKPPLEEDGAQADERRRRRAELLVEAAKLASEHGLADRALAAAVAAIEVDPTRADAIAIVEGSSHVEGGVAALDRAYQCLADAALGRYGRRAAHYRAARQFEGSGDLALALRHAAACFEAVPAEGTSYELLARLAERVGDSTEIVRAIERVAAASEPGARAVWLKRAASLAGTSPEGVRVRLDLLLRSFILRPDVEAVDDLGRAVRALALDDADLDIERMRFERAARTTMPKLDGPDGSRTAVAIARVAVAVFGDARLAFEALEHAMRVDGDLDDYATLTDVAAVLGQAKEARGFVAAVVAAADAPYASVGLALLRLASELARAVGDETLGAALLAQAARRQAAAADDASAPAEDVGETGAASEPAVVGTEGPEPEPHSTESAGVAELEPAAPEAPPAAPPTQEPARASVELAVDDAVARLEACRLEYLARGAGTPRQAQACVEMLGLIAPRLPPDQLEVQTFLLAEGLDVIQGGGAGLRELSKRHAELGPLPLIALGMAERLARSRSFDAALPLFEKALDGDLRGLRGRGHVAIAAADAAVQVSAFDAAARWLEEALEEPDARPLAQRRKLELQASSSDPEIARTALEQLATQTAGVMRARVLGQLARVITPTDPERAIELYGEAVSLATDRALYAILVEEQTLVKDSHPPLSPSPSAAQVEAAPASVPPAAASVAAESDSASAVEPAHPAVASPPPAEDDSPSIDVVAVIQGPASDPPAAVVGRIIEVAGSDEPVPSKLAPKAVEIAPKAVVIAPEAVVIAPKAVVIAPEAVVIAPEAVHDGGSAVHDAPGVGAASSTTPPKAAPVPPMPRRASSTPAMRRPSVPPTHAWSLHGEVALAEADPASAAVESVPSSIRIPQSSRPPKNAASLEADDTAVAALFESFNQGSFDAGERLVESFGSAPERTRDVLAIRRRQAELRPGERSVLEKLHDAAMAERDAVYARAIEHVLRAFDAGAGPLPPPPLAAQRTLPDGFAAILRRGLALPICEALGLVCESGLFKKDMSHYGLSGLERVQPNAPTLLGDTYGRIVRLFGYRAGLFHRRSPGELEAQIGLLAPPAVVLFGDVRDETPELKYMLGALLTGALDRYALLNALPEDDVRGLIDAMRAAFGPVGAAPRGSSAVVQLAQQLWQTMSPRAERRLREIFAETEGLDYEQALGASRQAMRRAGLFACGDLGLAVRKAIQELHLQLEVPIGAPDGLAKACAQSLAIADLVRFATGTEYADARWTPAPVVEGRAPQSTGRFRIPGT